MIINNVELKHPIIVFTGHFGCGKSYIANKLKNILDIGINLNRFDFFSRFILYIANVDLLNIKYKFINDIKLDFILIKYCTKKDFLNYVKNQLNDNQMDFELFNYFISNVIGINKFNNLTPEIEE
jgi:hypothetical protein